MPRARNIKPGFFTNEDLGECSFAARLCFAGLWTLADRAGRLEDRPKRIKGELFRFDTIDVDPLLAELEHQRFILRYEINGFKAIQILKFGEHQTPHYSEKPSVIKPPSISESSEKQTGAGGGNSAASSHMDSGSPPGNDAASRGGRNPLNPDSLNPDSLNPSPTVKTRASRLPADWSPGDSGMAYAAKVGLANGRVQAELEAFRDWWAAAPGQKGVKADWQATWRTWCRTAADRQPQGQRSGTDEPWANAK